MPTASDSHKLQLVVDGKNWASKLGVADVQQFEALVRDVGADIGMLVTTVGYSASAKTYAENVGGIILDVLQFNELPEWQPPAIRGVYCERCSFHFVGPLTAANNPGHCPRDGTPLSVLEKIFDGADVQ